MTLRTSNRTFRRRKSEKKTKQREVTDIRSSLAIGLYTALFSTSDPRFCVSTYHSCQLRIRVVRRRDFHEVGRNDLQPIKASQNRPEFSCRPSSSLWSTSCRSEGRINRVNLFLAPSMGGYRIGRRALASIER